MQVIFSSFSLMGFSLQALAESLHYTCMYVSDSHKKVQEE